MRMMLTYWPVMVALSGAGLVLALVFRRHTARLLRLARALATDRRLPRPVRWLFVAALAIKMSPVDFGIDEVLMVIGAVLLVGPYRRVFAEIRRETR